MEINQRANRLIRDFEAVLEMNGGRKGSLELLSGVDLGTANIVTAVVDQTGVPAAGMITRSQRTIRDGLVFDYMGAITILRRQVEVLRSAGYEIRNAAVAYPPGTFGRNASAFGHVLEAAGLDVCHLIDEPTAASKVLDITDGAVVDVGGGTTGISVIRNGEVVYTADEPTGGIHVDLVLSGHFKISEDEAERLKRDPNRQREIFPIIKPVFQKMGTIVKSHIENYPVKTVFLVGGTSCFPGIETVMAEETRLNVVRPENPLLVTPLGIALSCVRELAKAAV